MSNQNKPASPQTIGEKALSDFYETAYQRGSKYRDAVKATEKHGQLGFRSSADPHAYVTNNAKGINKQPGGPYQMDDQKHFVHHDVGYWENRMDKYMQSNRGPVISLNSKFIGQHGTLTYTTKQGQVIRNDFEITPAIVFGLAHNAGPAGAAKRLSEMVSGRCHLYESVTTQVGMIRYINSMESFFPPSAHAAEPAKNTAKATPAKASPKPKGGIEIPDLHGMGVSGGSSVDAHNTKQHNVAPVHKNVNQAKQH